MLTPTPTPLPWEWFDFTQPPKLLNPAHILPLSQGGHQQVWQLPLDHRPVPFKLFMQDPTNPRPLLILLHGMGLTIASFRGIAPYLLATHDLALVDYSSLTSTHWPHGGVALKTLALIPWKIADALSSQNFSLAGNSLGGGLSLIAALERPHDPRLQRLLLSNPACYPQTLPRMYRLARIPLLGELLMALSPPQRFVSGIEYIGYVDKSRFHPKLRHNYLHNLSQRKNRLRLMDLIRHLPANESDLTPAIHLPRLKEITHPTLLSFGEQDPLLTEDAGPRLAHDLPNCTYNPHPDLAHMPHEEAPHRLGPIWSNFLNPEKSSPQPS